MARCTTRGASEGELDYFSHVYETEEEFFFFFGKSTYAFEIRHRVVCQRRTWSGPEWFRVNRVCGSPSRSQSITFIPWSVYRIVGRTVVFSPLPRPPPIHLKHNPEPGTKTFPELPDVFLTVRFKNICARFAHNTRENVDLSPATTCIQSDPYLFARSRVYLFI